MFLTGEGRIQSIEPSVEPETYQIVGKTQKNGKNKNLNIVKNNCHK